MQTPPRRLLVALATVALAGCGDAPTVRWLADVVAEPSGLVASRQHPGVFWTHSDRGDAARVFAVDVEGRVRAEVRVTGAIHVDWEDVATDDAGHLYIGDFGNNDNDRKDLVVYRIAEPDPAAGPTSAPVQRRLRFRYPDQTRWPDPDAQNFDAEALFWADGTLWVLTKHRSDSRTTLYRFPTLDSPSEVALERVGDLDLGPDPAHGGGKATGADADPQGRRLVVLAYHAAFVLERADASSGWLDGPVHGLTLDAAALGQVEGVAWDGEDVWLVSEEGDLHRVPDVRTATHFP